MSAIVIKVKDPSAVISAKSQTAGKISSFVPEVASNFVYGKIRDKVVSGLAAEGVAADVQIVATPPSGPPPKSELVIGVVIGGGLVGLGLWLLRLLRRKH